LNIGISHFTNEWIGAIVGASIEAVRHSNGSPADWGQSGSYETIQPWLRKATMIFLRVDDFRLRYGGSRIMPESSERQSPFERPSAKACHVRRFCGGLSFLASSVMTFAARYGNLPEGALDVSSLIVVGRDRFGRACRVVSAISGVRAASAFSNPKNVRFFDANDAYAFSRLASAIFAVLILMGLVMSLIRMHSMNAYGGLRADGTPIVSSMMPVFFGVWLIRVRIERRNDWPVLRAGSIEERRICPNLFMREWRTSGSPMPTDETFAEST
jgi:hypothetical protein